MVCMISIVHTMPDYWGNLKMGLPRAYVADLVLIEEPSAA